jgi:hypothetical protein
MTAPLGKVALALAAKGLRVFPLRSRTKDPLINGWPDKATTDANVISGWWSSRDYNIGIATGPASGVWVLDLDDDTDEAWLRGCEAGHGRLPQTVEVISGKGRHLYFRWPTGANIRNIQNREDFPDVRGDGGYIVAPPSIHPSGRAYCWSVDSASEFADAPDWLVDLVTSRQTVNASATPPEAWRSFIEDTYEGSRRGHAIARLAGHLLRRYVDPYVTLSLCQQFNMLRCTEPLTWNDVQRIVNDVANREADRRETMRA